VGLEHFSSTADLRHRPTLDQMLFRVAGGLPDRVGAQ
jgi:hypothetical protein